MYCPSDLARVAVQGSLTDYDDENKRSAEERKLIPWQYNAKGDWLWNETRQVEQGSGREKQKKKKKNKKKNKQLTQASRFVYLDRVVQTEIDKWISRCESS